MYYKKSSLTDQIEDCLLLFYLLPMFVIVPMPGKDFEFNSNNAKKKRII